MTEDIVIISIICPECGEVLTEVHSDIIDDDLNIYFPSLTDKIDEISNNTNHNPNKRYIKCNNCDSTYEIKQEISEDI